MKKEFKKWLIRGSISFALLSVMIFWACGFEWYPDRESIVVENYTVEAGEYGNFTIEFKSNGDAEDRLILAIQVPKLWNAREAGNAEVTYEITTTDPGVIWETTLIDVNEQPVKRPGVSWEQHLMSRFSDQDPNVLDDMQWVAFKGKARHNSGGSDLNFKATFKVKTGPENLKAKIGFCVYRESEGGADVGINPGNDYHHFIVDWSDCFEVIEGEGDIIDFCDLHFNQDTPGMANQNDILTFRYIGDIADNDLMEVDDIYINMVATTTGGKKYEITEKTEKTKLMKESTWGLTYGKTFWAEEYFNISAGDTLDKIEYYFTNLDGSKYVGLYDDQHKNDAEVDETERLLTPFVFTFQK